MKSIVKLISLSLMLATCLWACTKDENREYILGGTNPVLTASSTAPLVLNVLNQNNMAISFSWTNPNYQFTTGVSSQDVSYALQFDTTGANFTNPKLQTKSISKDLAVTLTVKELNAILLSMDLQEGKAQNMEIRLVASFAGSIAPLASNVIKIVITPYLDVKYPVPTNLYIVGNATPGGDASGWNNPVPVPTQQFTKISSTLFQINSLALIGGKSYLLLPVNGSWAEKYGAIGGNGSNNPDVDDFKPNGGDLVAPAASGNYKIVIDFKRGKFTLTKL